MMRQRSTNVSRRVVSGTVGAAAVLTLFSALAQSQAPQGDTTGKGDTQGKTANLDCIEISP